MFIGSGILYGYLSTCFQLKNCHMSRLAQGLSDKLSYYLSVDIQASVVIVVLAFADSVYCDSYHVDTVYRCGEYSILRVVGVANIGRDVVKNYYLIFSLKHFAQVTNYTIKSC